MIVCLIHILIYHLGLGWLKLTIVKHLVLSLISLVFAIVVHIILHLLLLSQAGRYLIHVKLVGHVLWCEIILKLSLLNHIWIELLILILLFLFVLFLLLRLLLSHRLILTHQNILLKLGQFLRV